MVSRIGTGGGSGPYDNVNIANRPGPPLDLVLHPTYTTSATAASATVGDDNIVVDDNDGNTP